MPDLPTSALSILETAFQRPLNRTQAQAELRRLATAHPAHAVLFRELSTDGNIGRLLGISGSTTIGADIFGAIAEYAGDSTALEMADAAYLRSLGGAPVVPPARIVLDLQDQITDLQTQHETAIAAGDNARANRLDAEIRRTSSLMRLREARLRVGEMQAEFARSMQTLQTQHAEAVAAGNTAEADRIDAQIGRVLEQMQIGDIMADLQVQHENAVAAGNTAEALRILEEMGRQQELWRR